MEVSVVAPESSQITVRLVDGSTREVPGGLSAIDLATMIGRRLAKTFEDELLGAHVGLGDR